VLSGEAVIAEKVAARCTLAEFGTNDVLIRQDDTDTDVFIVLSGMFRVFVNGREIGERGPGQHLGEMAAIDLISRRTATVIASRPSLVAKMSGPDFLALADEHPVVWRAVAVELCRRLDARKKFHRTANDIPRIFIGSSRESLTRAETLKAAVETAAATKKVYVAVTIWSRRLCSAA
jgi:CRP-like cAMP-binding protein